MQDAYIKLFIPPAGASGSTMIDLDANWRQRWFAAPVAERGDMRTYTVRDSRMVPAVGFDEPTLLGMLPAADADLTALERPLPGDVQPEIDIDFVVHGEDGGGLTGPGSEWALWAVVGQHVSLLAPLRGSDLWSSWNPGAAERLLLLGDETALPATLSILRTLPHTARGSIYLEVPTAHDAVAYRQEANTYLAHLPGITVQFLARSGGQARGELLYAHLRRTCVQEIGLPKENVSFMGYWKQGAAEG